MIGIIFIAPPASGKGTQANMICQKRKFTYIGTGDILRKASLEETIEGLYIQTEMENGEFIDDDLMIHLFEKELLNTSNSFILDGFPRNINQAISLDFILEKINVKKMLVFYLDVPFDIVKERIVGRLVCPICGKVYNNLIEGLKPHNDFYCDKCNEKLIKRDDDNEITFNKRLKVYLEQTEPLVDYYSQKGYLYKINGFLEINEIFKTIDNIIEEVIKS